MDLKGENPYFPQNLPFHSMNVDLSTSRMHCKKTESKRAQGQAGQPRSVVGRPATLCPKKLWIFFQNSLVNRSIHFYP
jgi:hypothetical protein